MATQITKQININTGALLVTFAALRGPMNSRILLLNK